MRESRHGGHIVVIGSVAAFAPGFAGVACMASKAAVEQFGRALRIELGITDATAGVAYFGVVDTLDGIRTPSHGHG